MNDERASAANGGKMGGTMRSSEVARIAGVTVRTLRHYHALGLLPEPPRSENGYRSYTATDVARVLRIKRLASLGFPLSRVGEVMAEMDASAATANGTDAHAAATDGGADADVTDSLAELDRELALQIERLEEQRRTIAALRAERLAPDLPPRFARAIRSMAGADAIENASYEDRTALLIAAHSYDDNELAELERIADLMENEGLAHAINLLGERCADLPADAPEPERASLVAYGMETLAPLLPYLDTRNWLRPDTEAEQLAREASNEGLNEAQRDVLHRIDREIARALEARLRDEGAQDASTPTH